MTTRSAVLAGLVAALLLPAHTRALPGLPISPWPAGELVPGEVLVKFKPQVSAQGRSAALASLGHARLASLGAGGWLQIRVAPGQTVAEAVAAYAGNPDVELAQPNFVYHASALPNDPFFGLQWGLRNTGQKVTNAAAQPPGLGVVNPVNNPGVAGDDMRLEAAWNHLTDCSSVVVAVIDTGVKYDQEDLAGSLWDGGPLNPNHGKNFVGGAFDDATLDLAGHGTHVAGTIGALGDNSVGGTGVCWKARIMAVRVLDATGSGTTADIVRGIQFALDNGAKVINMSLGGNGFDAAYSEEISAAQAADAVVVAAAGNDGTDNENAATPVYPCNFTQPNLVCVAALDQAYQRASFSNYGAASVDVGAPGTNIVSTWPGTTHYWYDPLDVPNSGWTATGWTFTTALGPNALVDPSNYGSGVYADGVDHRAYHTYSSFAGSDVAVASFLIAADVLAGDWVRLACASTAADPFGPSGTTLRGFTQVATGIAQFASWSEDISGCLAGGGATCTLGFQLQTDSYGVSSGVAIAELTFETLAFGTASYHTINGTSMAAPAVAGVAALLRAYNPQFTYADVVGALRGGGRAVPALAGITTTGKAVDAMGSLAFVNPPTGLTYTVK